MKFLRETALLALAAFLLLAWVACGDQYRPVANPIISGGGQPQSTHFAYVVNSNPNGTDGSTTQIDVSGDTNSAVNTLGVGSIYEAFPPNSGALFIANSGNDTVSEYLPILSSAVTTISLLAGIASCIPQFGATRVHVRHQLRRQLQLSEYGIDQHHSAIDIERHQHGLCRSQSHCDGPIGGQRPIYVLNQGDNSLTVYNPSTGSVTGTITTANGLGVNPVSLTASIDGNWIFVVTQGDGVSPGELDIIAAGADHRSRFGAAGSATPLSRWSIPPSIGSM